MLIEESFEKYRKQAKLNYSTLKLWESTLQYLKLERLKEYIESERPISSSMLNGHSFHKLVLEPEAFEQDEKLKICLSKNQFQNLYNMKKSILKNKRIKEILNNKETLKEIPCYFKDNWTGLDCKSRFDICSKSEMFLCDIKTTRSIDNFKYVYKKYNYAEQAGFYYLAAKKNKIQIKNFIFIIQESGGNYETAFLKIDKEELEDIKKNVLKKMHEYNEWRQHKKIDHKKIILL